MRICKLASCKKALVRRPTETPLAFQTRKYCCQACFNTDRSNKMRAEVRELALTKLAELHMTEFLRLYREEMAKAQEAS